VLGLGGTVVGKTSGARRIGRTLWRERELWLITAFFVLWVAVFAYYPMYGLLAAFVDYLPGRAIIGSEWVGFRYFVEFVKAPAFWQILRNTLAISTLGILFGFPAPIVLSLLFNELRGNRFKRVAQTISYLPHFVSWVVVASLMFRMLGNEGLINELALRAGYITKPIPFLGDGRYFWTLITAANVWKGVGWSSIIYLSAIAGIDAELYQAGMVDGLGRFGLTWHITLPGIRTTAVLLFILSIGGILNAGFEQQLLLGNDLTREYHEVIDTYAYKYGIQLGRYAYGTAVGFMKSVIALGLVLLANRIAKRTLDVAVI
jgi:putative aldouronate transport system permease protein